MNGLTIHYMTKIKLGKQVCNKCKQPANTFHKKWWCGRDFMGNGICKNDNKKSSS